MVPEILGNAHRYFQQFGFIFKEIPKAHSLDFASCSFNALARSLIRSWTLKSQPVSTIQLSVFSNLVSPKQWKKW